MGRARGCLLLAWVFATPLYAKEQAVAEPLPEPLTLEAALALADGDHPDMMRARGRLQAARAARAEVDAESGVYLGMELAARVIEPSDASAFQQHNDSFARLYVRKRLYDFGRTQWRREAGDAEIQARQWALIDARQQRRIEVMSRFFDVHLADLENARDTEAVAVAYVRLDKARARHRLKQLSDVALSKLEADYQTALRRQRVSEARQRTRRAQLAVALNRPDSLPAELEWPALPDVERVPEALDALVEAALAGNPRLKSLRAARDAEMRRVHAARADRYPVLRGELEAADYNRPSGGRAPLAASLALDVPFYDGGQAVAEVTRHQALVQQRRAELAAAELDLRQQVLELWSEINTLRARKTELEAVGEYRELVLDRSRALYEMEVTSDLGDAQVRISDQHLQRAENGFNLALDWARLDALAGRPITAAGRETGRGE